jgi:hypothetical protein
MQGGNEVAREGASPGAGAPENAGKWGRKASTESENSRERAESRELDKTRTLITAESNTLALAA